MVFVGENPIKLDDLGVPQFQETSTGIKFWVPMANLFNVCLKLSAFGGVGHLDLPTLEVSSMTLETEMDISEESGLGHPEWSHPSMSGSWNGGTPK